MDSPRFPVDTVAIRPDTWSLDSLPAFKMPPMPGPTYSGSQPVWKPEEAAQPAAIPAPTPKRSSFADELDALAAAV